MTRTHRLFCTVLLSITLAGCGIKIRPDQETLDRADFGPYPAAYEQTITAFMQRRLRDPDSARYRFVGNPRQYFYGVGGEPYYGWRVCAWINAKNGYGGYTGEQLAFFLLRDGRVAKSVHTQWAADTLCER